MPNIWHIWHTKHKKRSIIRYVKCIKCLQHVTIPSQIWDSTNNNCKIYIVILFLFSLSSSQISLSSSSLSSLSSLFVFHSTPITKGHHSTSPISPKATTRHHRSFVFSILLQVFFFLVVVVVHVFWLWFDRWVGQWVSSDGQISGGWVEMVIGGLVVVGGSAGDGRIGDGWVDDGESVVSELLPFFFFFFF